jgi:hypothetical protein
MELRVKYMQTLNNTTSKRLSYTDKVLNPLSDTTNREEEHRTRFEQSIKDLLRVAKSYYETNRKINLIVVGVGLVFLANAIARTWVHGVDSNDNTWLSLASGGLSVATFVALFFTKSQENITRAFGNLTQIQMIYKAYCLQFDALLDFHLRQEDANLDIICSMNNAAGTIANNAARLVQDNIETEEAKITGMKTESTFANGVNTIAATTIKAATTAGDNNTTKSK